MLAKIIERSLTKSKKDNIYCLYLGFDTRCFGIENVFITPEEEGEVLEMSLSNCESDDVLQEVRVVIPAVVVNAFEFMSYSISKAKEEVYVYFYEYPYEEDDLEEVKCDIDYELIRMPVKDV